jgi:Malectin domain/IPT/TIG domain
MKTALLVCWCYLILIGLCKIEAQSISMSFENANSIIKEESSVESTIEKTNSQYSAQRSQFIKKETSTNQQIQQSVSSIVLPYRVNCGQNATSNYTDPSTGKTWLPDRFATNGHTHNGCPTAILQNKSIANHLCLIRNGFNFAYNFPVPYIGSYKLTMYFAETYFTVAGKRIFTVAAEGKNILTNLDVVASTGGILRPVSHTFMVNVTDGVLSLQFSSSVDRAMISAIEIENGKPSPLSTVRISCGSFVPYTDPLTMNVWSPDVNFQNGNRYTACPVAIPNSNIDPIYCSERWFGGGPGFNGTYTIPVIPGMYTVRLMFAELYFPTANSRVFNVYVQNQLVRSKLDILAVTGGRNLSLIVPVVATASTTDPNIRLTLQNVVQNAKISGIEIIPYNSAPTVPTAPIAPIRQPTKMPVQAPTNSFNPILINSGSNVSFTDSLARVFLPDKYFTGGMIASRVVPISNTVDDNLYQYGRVGDNITYEIPVPIGTYAVALLFSENQYNAAGQRLFDVTVEGERLNNIDIFRIAGGALTATRLQFFRPVDDSSLTIRFTKSVQFPNAGVPTLSGIEVALDQPHVAHAVATGPYISTVVNPVTNKADVQLIGETSHTHGAGLALTSFTWKEGNTVLGTKVNTNYSFGVGLHTVSLTIKDDGGNLNTETTTVSINPFGFPAITSLVPNSGSLAGQYPVILRGSGFNYTANQIKVQFGSSILSGTAIQILNQTAIQVLAPSSVVTQAVSVTVQTPLGTSVASEFNYVGSVPILWKEYKLLDYLQPTVGRFGPDRRLYVGTRYGRILKVTMNSDFTAVINTIIAFVNKVDKETM